MMETFDENLTEFASILEAFSAEQRSRAMAESKRQRVTMIRTIADKCQVSFEAVIDEDTDAAEIFGVLERVDQATDRLAAKAHLADYYNQILNISGQIEVAIRKLAEDGLTFRAEADERNRGRHTERGITDQQKSVLESHRKSIKDGFARIDEIRVAIGEAKRILVGDDALAVVERQIEIRMDKLRSHRLTEAS